MPVIKNERYNLKKIGSFQLMESTEFYEKLSKIKARQILEEPLKWFFLLLFWTGRRPSEILDLLREDITEYNPKTGEKALKIHSETRKKGRPTDIYLFFENIPMLQEFWNWTVNKPMGMKLFGMLQSETTETIRYLVQKKVFVQIEPGKNIYKQLLEETGETREKTYPYLSIRMGYWSNKFFGVPPYFFRHNRFSYMAIRKNMGFRDIQIFKGAKTIESVLPYVNPDKDTLIGIGKQFLKS